MCLRALERERGVRARIRVCVGVCVCVCVCVLNDSVDLRVFWDVKRL